MSRARNKQFKANLARELRTAAEELLEAGLIHDGSPLRGAAASCAGSDPKNKHWHYSLINLEFIVGKTHLDKYRNTIPINLVEIRIYLSVSARGICLQEDDNTDPFEKLVVDCKIEARKKDNSDPYISAWHLDRNEDDSGNASRHFVHPLYHFQFGGNKLPQDLGRFLFIEPPRLVHPPLDAVLAVDFVLTNYFPATWCELRSENVRYARIVQQAQQRCWRPYAKSSTTAWLPGNHPWTADSIWPQLIRR